MLFPLKVHDEKLIEPAVAAADMVGVNIVRAGGTNSALEVVVCVEPSDADQGVGLDLEVGTEITISLFHSDDTAEDAFIPLPAWTQIVTAPADDPDATSITHLPGSIIARMTLPYDCKMYVKGNLGFAGGAMPAGKVSMFTAYLPR